MVLQYVVYIHTSKSSYVQISLTNIQTLAWLLPSYTDPAQF